MFMELPGNAIININHITSINFTPERSGFDEEENQSYHLQASLTIGLTETVIGTHDRFDGEFLGVAAVANRLVYYGQNAIAIWNHFQSRTMKINLSTKEHTS